MINVNFIMVLKYVFFDREFAKSNRASFMMAAKTERFMRIIKHGSKILPRVVFI